MPQLFDALVADAGLTGSSDRQVTNGSPLKYNWETGGNEGSKGKVVLPVAPGYDVVVLTEATPLQQHMCWSDTITYGGNFLDLCLQGNPQCVGYMYATWPGIDAASWKSGTTWEQEMQNDLHGGAAAEAQCSNSKAKPVVLAGLDGVATALTAAHSTPVGVIPANTAMAALLQAVDAGGVPTVTSRAQIFKDTIHMTTPLGNYFVACVMFSTIYNASPVGLTTSGSIKIGFKSYDLTPATAAALQKIAWDAVQARPQPAHVGKGGAGTSTSGSTAGTAPSPSESTGTSTASSPSPSSSTPGTTPSPSESTGTGTTGSTTGDPGGGVKTTVSGYLVDIYCWDKPNHMAIDGANLETEPEKHTVHCLRDVQVCINGGYALLEKKAGALKYTLKYKLDATGNVNILKIIKTTASVADFQVTATGTVDGDVLKGATFVEGSAASSSTLAGPSPSPPPGEVKVAGAGTAAPRMDITLLLVAAAAFIF